MCGGFFFWKFGELLAKGDGWMEKTLARHSGSEYRDGGVPDARAPSKCLVGDARCMCKRGDLRRGNHLFTGDVSHDTVGGGFWTTASAMGESLIGRLQAKAGLVNDQAQRYSLVAQLQHLSALRLGCGERAT